MITLFNAASIAPISQPFTVVKQVTVYATGLVFGDEIQFETVTYAEAPPSAQDQSCCDTPACSPCIPNPGQARQLLLPPEGDGAQRDLLRAADDLGVDRLGELVPGFFPQ